MRTVQLIRVGLLGGMLLLVVGAGLGCAYPRRSTNAVPAPFNAVRSEDVPKNMWTFRVISAELPRNKPTGLPWDSDGTGPDPFVKLFIDKKLIWQSEVKENTSMPEWSFTLPKNIVVTDNAIFRMEVWDRDTVADADPMGSLSRNGLPPNLMPDAEARMFLDNNAMLTAMVSQARANIGVGLTVEARPAMLLVLEVEPYSPASRAGIRKGDRIVAVGEERVTDMAEQEAISALSLAAERSSKLVLADESGASTRTVELDGGFLWTTY